MSCDFLLKTLKKLIDKHTIDRWYSLMDYPLHSDQDAYQVYRTGPSTETGLHLLVINVEETLQNKRIMLGAFWTLSVLLTALSLINN